MCPRPEQTYSALAQKEWPPPDFISFFLWRRHFLSVGTVRPHGQTIRTVAESVQVVVQLHVISAHVVDVHAILGGNGVECGVTAL